MDTRLLCLSFLYSMAFWSSWHFYFFALLGSPHTATNVVFFPFLVKKILYALRDHTHTLRAKMPIISVGLDTSPAPPPRQRRGAKYVVIRLTMTLSLGVQAKTASSSRRNCAWSISIADPCGPCCPPSGCRCRFSSLFFHLHLGDTSWWIRWWARPRRRLLQRRPFWLELLVICILSFSQHRSFSLLVDVVFSPGA